MPVPSTVLPLVKALVIRERFPGAAINHEGMRDANSLAIAVDFIGRTKPADIHVAVGDFELSDGELQRSVDSKLVLLERVAETWRLLYGFVQAARRDLVIEIAGSDREKLCRPNRDVDLYDR